MELPNFVAGVVDARGVWSLKIKEIFGSGHSEERRVGQKMSLSSKNIALLQALKGYYGYLDYVLTLPRLNRVYIDEKIALEVKKTFGKRDLFNLRRVVKGLGIEESYIATLVFNEERQTILVYDLS